MKLTTPRHRPPMRCKIKVTTKDGINHIYSGLFQTTTDAAADALVKFGFGNKISVRKTT